MDPIGRESISSEAQKISSLYDFLYELSVIKVSNLIIINLMH
jgi:hypothetical protein